MNKLKAFWCQKIKGATPLDSDEWVKLTAGFEILQKLEETQQEKLKTLIAEFLCNVKVCDSSQKRVSRQTQLYVASQACLLVINLGLDWYPDLKKVILVEDEKQQGFDDSGQIVTLPAMADGKSNLMHLFARQLDLLTGTLNGIPPFHFEIKESNWLDVFNNAYQDFSQRVKAGPQNEILFDTRASENLASFFAIMSEAFFVSSDAVRCAYPDVYLLLQKLYRINPAILQKTGVLNPFSVLD